MPAPQSAGGGQHQAGPQSPFGVLDPDLELEGAAAVDGEPRPASLGNRMEGVIGEVRFPCQALLKVVEPD